MSPDLSSFRSNPTTTPPPPPPPVVSPAPPSSVSPPFYLNNSESVDQHHIQKNLRDLIDNARESWTYAVLWQSFVVDGTSQSRWGDGYYRGETKTTTSFTTSTEEQEYRKTVLQELNSVVSGSRNNEVIDEVVTDTEWFFLISMTHSFVTGNGLAGQAMSSNQPVWICGQEELMASSCDRARQGESFGLKTMVCIPTTNGVVEFGSTETIFRNSDLINEVGVLFNSPLDLMPTN